MDCRFHRLGHLLDVHISDQSTINQSRARKSATENKEALYLGSGSEKSVCKDETFITRLKEVIAGGPRPDIDWNDFNIWLNHKYSKTYIPTILCYTKKYHSLIHGNLRELDRSSRSVKTNTIKALVILSKYQGIHKEFRNRLEDYGIKTYRPDSLSSFLRILKANNSDILKWYNNALDNVKDHETAFLKFSLYSGVRKIEAIASFNLIIQLHKQNRLSQYYDKIPNTEAKCLQHFKHPEMFIRRTKNVFISFLPEEIIYETANSKQVTYPMIHKRLRRKGLKTRINELRDFYGTFMLNHGLLEQEVNLLQGRIPPSIFIKFYWSPKLEELKDRTLKAISLMEQSF